MDGVLRAGGIYFMLLIFLRFVGKRSLSEITTFDFVVLLIIGEAVAQGLLGENFSLTNAVIVVITLLFLDVILSLIKQRSSTAEKLIDSVPVLLVENGNMIKEHMEKSRVDEEGILESARETQRLERMEQIKYAVLERAGKISIVPQEGAGS